jgi:protein-disulfide isomerase
MHYLLRKLILKHPDTLRLVHYNYPLDHEFNPILVQTPFHIGSGKLALLSINNHGKENFWKINDAIYRLVRKKTSQTIELKQLSESTGISLEKLKHGLLSPENRKRLQNDIETGLRYHISATPAFVINNKVYQGHIPENVLTRLKSN